MGKSFKEMQAETKERLQKKIAEIPKIHWEILGYANHHTKDDVLLKYPEHEAFINTIHFNISQQ